ncbi:MAG: hypothetical protein WC026_11060 [Hyphomicrobium sp.]|uniref:hypothetical protein n=1 Tax=Hyphomicrobium sp. TaxID=82 RepID=UPI0035627B5A
MGDEAQGRIEASDEGRRRALRSRSEPIARVLRVIEYVGPRSAVEIQVAKSLHGDLHLNGVTIKAATVGTFPEILSGENVPSADASAIIRDLLSTCHPDCDVYAVTRARAWLAECGK